MDLKKVTYKNIGGEETGFLEAEVVYAIFKNQCIFTGVTSENRTSTIEAAEKIIAAICGQEKILLEKLKFFDLQTHKGYISKKPGIFEFDEIVFTTADNDHQVINDLSWRPKICPEHIRKAFAEFIG